MPRPVKQHEFTVGSPLLQDLKTTDIAMAKIAVLANPYCLVLVSFTWPGVFLDFFAAELLSSWL